MTEWWETDEGRRAELERRSSARQARRATQSKPRRILGTTLSLLKLSLIALVILGLLGALLGLAGWMLVGAWRALFAIAVLFFIGIVWVKVRES